MQVVTQGLTVYTPYEDARPVLEALAAIVPAELKGAGTDPEQAWSRWRVAHDRAIRARLDRGDDDSLVNWLLFGTSFTARPRVDLERPAGSPDGDRALASLVSGRAADLVTFLARPDGEERAGFGRRVLARAGYPVDSADGREAARAYLLSEVARVAREQRALGDQLAAARRSGDVTEELATRARLFQSRGLSLDTSIAPGLAIERALAAMIAEGRVRRGGVRRVLIIGPGLDFADKLGGFDFYPEQTLQPFAIIDTLVRLDLASARDIEVTTADVSVRVKEHLRRAVAAATRGAPYILQLPLDGTRPWQKDMRDYWMRIGSSIGTDSRPAPIPSAVQAVQSRAVRIPPEVVRRIRFVDLNVVVQRIAEEPFDLAVATNVLVYYDLLDQSFAIRNIAAMLRSGGFLLSNNALLELPGSPLASAGYLTTRYSDRPDDGDQVIWYRRVGSVR
jgi:hypothetical protein